MEMTRKYKIELLKSAEVDLEQIYHYIFFHDSPRHADYVLDKIDEAIFKLENMPHRGVYPPELYELGIISHRQINFKPYRIIYSIDEESRQVFIEVIIDSRRNVEPILVERFSSDD